MKKVLLTGITGYIGLHCAAELIKQGYYVKGSLRSIERASGVIDALSKHLEQDISGKIEFCELDLLQDEGWEEAAKGCDFLMHVASPFIQAVPKDENKLVRPAVDGTLRALKAAQKASIKRIVLTSSMVAMMGDLKGDPHINDKSWTDVNLSSITPYIKSKTIAETQAWEYTKENQLEMVTIHPGPVYGPPIGSNLSGESMSLFTKVLQGKVPLMIRGSMNISDVRDIAKIHVKALEQEGVIGHRFIVASDEKKEYPDIVRLLKSNGYRKVNDKQAPTFLVRFMANFDPEMKGMLPFAGKFYYGDVEPTKSVFDWEPIPFQKTILDTAEALSKILPS